MNDNLLIYQVFVRNYSKIGDFKSVTKNLDYIASLGVDILYLLPIHEIGVLHRKGSFGSPYAVKDYFSITPDYGSLNDFKQLLSEAHKRRIKVIIDIVFHHTSPDNELLLKHPEFYYYKDGKPGNAVGDWGDIIDLDTTREDTQNYLLSVLRYWISVGVDGFRFDVASMIAFSFFEKARKALGDNVIFFGESVDMDFAKYLREIGLPSTPDHTMYPVFDYLYNYNYFRAFERQAKEGNHIPEIVDIINQDLVCNPMHTRAHCLENHDTKRFVNLVKDPAKQRAWIDLATTLYGHMFLYMGQENGCQIDVPLFEKQAVEFSIVDEELKDYYLLRIKEKKNRPQISDQKLIAIDPNTIRIDTMFADGANESKIISL